MPFNIRMALRRIAPFCSKNLSDRRTDREKEGSRVRVGLFWWKAELKAVLRARRYRDDVRARAHAAAVECAHPKVVSGICAQSSDEAAGHVAHIQIVIPGHEAAAFE